MPVWYCFIMCVCVLMYNGSFKCFHTFHTLLYFNHLNPPILHRMVSLLAMESTAVVYCLLWLWREIMTLMLSSVVSQFRPDLSNIWPNTYIIKLGWSLKVEGMKGAVECIMGMVRSNVSEAPLKRPEEIELSIYLQKKYQTKRTTA